MSAASEAERSPALFLKLRPPWADCSRRTRLAGRADCGFAPFIVAEFGGFLVDIDGEGDDLMELAPLVWMPGGTGRLILDATAGGWIAVTTGAILPDGAATGPQRG